MDELFQDKLQLLQLYYPAILHDVLKDFLCSCDEDLEVTRSLIDGKPKAKKRRTAVQTSLTSLKQKKRLRTATGETRHGFESDPPSIPSPRDNGHFRKTSQIITLNTPREVEEHLHPYASLHLNFLPENLSNGLVQDLLEMKKKFRSNKFFLFGNRCELNNTTGVFARPAAAYTRLVYNGLETPRPFPYTNNMEDMAKRTEQYLNNEVIPCSERLKWQLKEPWINDFSVINCYEKLQNNMDWHSDRLSHIGPHNYVASISLGTTRMFRLRCTYKDHAPVYQVPLPHNSLFIMRPGCQEEFKHCVSPMLKAIDVHPTLGTMRFGITARCYSTFFIENLPKCKCGTGMVLRRSHKAVASRGKYFWLCENVYQNKGCPTFYWCDFTNVEGNYIAIDENNVSSWVAPDDFEKMVYMNQLHI